MNAPLRRVGVVVLVLFGLLFVNLNWVQGYLASSYRNNEHNGRVQVIINATKRVRSYDLATGKELWQHGGMTVNRTAGPRFIFSWNSGERISAGLAGRGIR